MPSTINTNLASLNTQNNLHKSQSALQTSIQRLSSGLRVNSAKDDAAGFGIASRMDATIRGQTVAIRNANDAISYSQTTEGALSQIGDNLQRMRELAVQAANGSNGSDDRTALQTEFSQLQSEITRITDSTKFNGIDVLKSTTAVTFQVGANNQTYDQISMSGVDLSDAASKVKLAVPSTVKIDSPTGAQGSLDTIDLALKEVNTKMTDQGAYQNRFTAVINTLRTSTENQTAARSRIVDTDYAAETSNLARNQILQQAGMAMLAQANQLPNNVLSLLR